MAIDNGNLMSGIRGSAGNTTWRRVRGRTIQSQKRQSGKNTIQTRAVGGLVRTYREAMFFIMTAFADSMQNTINESFNPTKYGSRRNAFFKLNYSAVERVINGTELGLALIDAVMHNVSFTGVTSGTGATQRAILALDEVGWNNLFSAADAAGLVGSYIRSNIGGVVYQGYEGPWDATPDPGTGAVTSMVCSIGSATAAGQTISSIRIDGTNLVLPPTFSIRVGNPNSTPLTGSWANNVWTPSGDSATRRFIGTNTIYICDGTRVVYQRDVTFYSGNPSAGGE